MSPQAVGTTLHWQVSLVQGAYGDSQLPVHCCSAPLLCSGGSCSPPIYMAGEMAAKRGHLQTCYWQCICQGCPPQHCLYSPVQVATGCRVQNEGCQVHDVGRGTHDAGYRVHNEGCRMGGAERRMQEARCRGREEGCKGAG